MVSRFLLLALTQYLGHRLQQRVRLLYAKRLSFHLELPLGAGNARVVPVHQWRRYLLQKLLAPALRTVLRPVKLVRLFHREEPIVKRLSCSLGLARRISTLLGTQFIILVTVGYRLLLDSLKLFIQVVDRRSTTTMTDIV